MGVLGEVGDGIGATVVAESDEASGADGSIGSLLVPNRLGVWSWVFGFTAILTTLSVLRYDLWLATGFDLGMYEQGLWLIWHEGIKAASSFTGHPLLGLQAAYMLVPLALVYHVGGTGALLALQSLSLGLGYLLLRRIGETLGLPDRTAHLVGAVYLIYPVVLGSNLFDFHPVVLAVPLLLAAVHAALRRRLLTSAIWLVLALCAADTLAIPILFLALALLLRRQTGAGLVAAGTAVAFALLDGLVILPHVGGPAAGVRGVLAAAGIPAGTARLVQWPHSLRSWEYLIWMLGPLAGLLLGGWRRALNPFWLPALAVMTTNLASSAAAATSPFNQWSVSAVPFLFVAVLAALPDGKVALRHGKGRLRRLWLVGPAMVFLGVFGWHQLRTNWHTLPHRVAVLAAEATAVPADAPLVAQNFALPQFANRPLLLLPTLALRRALPAGTYILLEPSVTTGTTPATAIAALESQVGDIGRPSILYQQSGIMLERTTAPVATGGPRR